VIPLNQWHDIRAEYFAWLRYFPLLTNIGIPEDSREVICSADGPVFLNVPFWSERTHELEARALQHLQEEEIDLIFNEVAAVIDENLLRFDPLIAYYSQFFPEGHPERLDAEHDAAHSAKRDLAWAAIERAIREPAFFCRLLEWYDQGRWPLSWQGDYPSGHLLVL
jgi:hypothetical protein